MFAYLLTTSFVLKKSPFAHFTVTYTKGVSAKAKINFMTYCVLIVIRRTRKGTVPKKAIDIKTVLSMILLVIVLSLFRNHRCFPFVFCLILLNKWTSTV